MVSCTSCEVERLHEIGGGAEFFGGDGVVEIAVRGDDERRAAAARVLADLFEHVEAAHVGQADVEDDERELAARRVRRGRAGRWSGARLVAEAAADGGERGGEGVFVFDDEDGFMGLRMADWRSAGARAA